MPGDTIQMKAGRLYINGTMIERQQVGAGNVDKIDAAGNHEYVFLR